MTRDEATTVCMRLDAAESIIRKITKNKELKAAAINEVRHAKLAVMIEKTQRRRK